MNTFRKVLVVIITVIVLVVPFAVFSGSLPSVGDPNSAPNTHVSDVYIEQTEAICNSPNMVTSVIVDFRAFDTLYETTVMFLAGVCVVLILSEKNKGAWSPAEPDAVGGDGKNPTYRTINKEVMVSIIEPVILIYAIYVLFHGEVSLGGGFQAGALIAMVYLLDVMVTKRKRNIFTFSKFKSAAAAGLGPFIYALCGIITMIGGGLFLEYRNFPLPMEEAELHSVGILMVEVGVTIGVMCTIITILNTILERAVFDDDDN